MHLNGEALARLVDEAPNAEQAAHLAKCEQCALKLEAYREDHAALAALGPVTPPAGSWERLQQRMDQELSLEQRRNWSPQLRAAAAALIFVAGSVTGGTVVAMTGSRAEVPQATQLAQAPESNDSDAEQGLRQAEEQYMRAVDRYAEYSEPEGPIDPVNRLAALEGILLTTEAALRDAPADPIINNYHIATLGLREALIRQLSEESDEEWF